MATEAEFPKKHPTKMEQISSQSAVTIAEEKASGTPNYDNDSRAENDFVEMMDHILEEVIPKTETDGIQNSLQMNTENMGNMDTNEILITVPQKRLLSAHGHRRKGGSSLMGSMVVNIRFNPETAVIEEETDALPSVHSSDTDNDHDALSPDHDSIHEIVDILKKSIHDRSKNEIDILVTYFEHYQIMSDDVDQWSGQHTFRALIRDTKYMSFEKHASVYNKGDDDNLCFYFILGGKVLLDDVIVTANEIFGEKEMYKLEPRLHSCSVSSHHVHLAYWDKEAYNNYIRPIKELNTNIKEEKGLLHDKYGNLLTETDLIEKASMFLDDSIHGRSFKMHRNGKLPRKVHRILIDKKFRYCIISVCLLWLSLMWVEPPSSLVDNDPATSSYAYIMRLIMFEWLVLLIFLSECLLRVFSYGSRWFLTNRLHVYRVVLLSIFFLDLAIATWMKGKWFRFSRVFRPFYLMLFIRDLRRQYFILLSCIPSVLELVMLYLAVVGIFARIGYHIFDHTTQVYDRDDFLSGTGVYFDELHGENAENAQQYLYVGVFSSFTTFFWSALSLFVLLTTENYPELFWPAWLSRHVYYSYFLSYILISTFFLQNLFSASVYNAYQQIIARLDVVDEGREATALRVAWNCLDYDDKGYIEPDRFAKLMRKLKPHYNQFEIDVLFKLIDTNGDKCIEVAEFSEMMINCLYFSISKRSASREDELKLYLQRLGAVLGRYGYDILSVFTSPTYSNIILLFVSLDVCFLLSYHFSPKICNYGDVLCLAIIILNIAIDIIFKHQSKVRRYFETTKNKIFFAITLIQTVGTVIGITGTLTGKRPSYLSGLRFIGISRVLLMASFLRDRFSFLKHSTSNTLTQTVIYMIPVFLRICFYLFVGFLYMFSIVGMELFYDWRDHDTWGQSRCDGAKQMQSNPYALFCDASATFITLFQILTTNNWHQIMYQAIDTTGNYYIALYFITFFVLGPILTVNFLLAVFFDMFFGVSLQHQETEQNQTQTTEGVKQAIQSNIKGKKRKQTLHSIPCNIKEIGISTLSDGTSILTLRKRSINENDFKLIYDKGEDENDEYIHLTLMSVAKSIWKSLKTESYRDSDGNEYHNTFNGKSAVECIRKLRYAPDEEDAIDYLSQIMEQEAIFSRIDNNDAAMAMAQFENSDNAHYQWIVEIFNKEAENDDIDVASDSNPVVNQQEIMIGVRHSYGGFQRLMKQNRRIGAENTSANAVNAGTLESNTEIIKSNTTLLSNYTDTETSRTNQTPKAKTNIFSKRNLLDFHQPATNNAVDDAGDADDADDAKDASETIKNALVILIGDSDTELDVYNTVFEQHYNFSVIRTQEMASLTVSKYFNIDKYDAIILILNKMKHSLNLKHLYNLFTKKLGLKAIQETRKLVIYIKDEFENDDDDEDADADEDEYEEYDEDELFELFGIICCSDDNFSKHFVNELNNNNHNPSLIALIHKVTTLITNNIYLHQFDSRLLLCHFIPNNELL